MNSSRRLLVLSLAVSIVLHLVLFYVIQIGVFADARHAPPLQVRLIIQETRRVSGLPNTFTKDDIVGKVNPPPRSTPDTKTARDVFDFNPVHASTIEKTNADSNVEKAFSALSPPAQQITSDQLLETARKIAREEAKKITPSSHESLGNDDLPVLPELDRVLKEKPRGEMSFADGTTRVVTKFGTTYCLKPPPDFARTGIGAQISAPMLCP